MQGKIRETADELAAHDLVEGPSTTATHCQFGPSSASQSGQHQARLDHEAGHNNHHHHRHHHPSSSQIPEKITDFYPDGNQVLSQSVPQCLPDVECARSVYQMLNTLVSAVLMPSRTTSVP